jgi:hypothetical protein
MTGQGKVYALPNDWELADRRLELLEDPRLWFYGPAKVIAWGRRC